MHENTSARWYEVDATYIYMYVMVFVCMNAQGIGLFFLRGLIAWMQVDTIGADYEDRKRG